ncbi:MAG: hypothetical protein AAF357_01670 [Verrucomicrobiota bacterium]
MKPLTPRERNLITILPAVIFVLVYALFFARPAGQELQKLRQEIGKASQNLPSAQEQSQIFSELQALENEVLEKRVATREWHKRKEELLAYWSDSDAKARGGEFISLLLADQGVVLVQEAIAGADDQERFADLLEVLPSAELWHLQLAGSYDALRHTVAALGETDLPLVPAGVQMEPRIEGNRTIHLWNLWICR